MSVEPALDHVVVNARQEFGAAEECYRRLGFTLTPLGRHSLGSINRLALFPSDYLELVGIDPQAAAPRAELMASPLGLNGLVFATDDAAALHHALAERGAPVEPPADFSRPQGTAEARFRVVRVAASHTPYGRVYFCQHLPRGLVWGAAGHAHANGAVAIARVAIAAPDPVAAGALYRLLFGDEAVAEVPGGVALAMGAVRLDAVGAGADRPASSVAAPRRWLHGRAHPAHRLARGDAARPPRGGPAPRPRRRRPHPAAAGGGVRRDPRIRRMTIPRRRPAAPRPTARGGRAR